MHTASWIKTEIQNTCLEEEHDLDKFVRQVTNPKTNKREWAFIDIHNPRHIFKYFGQHKPSAREILNELHAVEYYKNK